MVRIRNDSSALQVLDKGNDRKHVATLATEKT